jgi:cholesterol transport system auxiliary component
MTTIRRRDAIRYAASAPLLLASCGGVLDARKDAPPSEYRLTARPVFASDLPRADWVLVVTEPEADGALDSDRIAIMAQGRIDRVADVAWSDRPSAMLEHAMVQAFQGSGRLKGVGTERDDLPSRYMLQSTLDAFQLEPEGERLSASVGLSARLLRLPGREVVASKEFARRVPAVERSNTAAVAAFDAAVTGLLEEIVPWTLRAGRR